MKAAADAAGRQICFMGTSLHTYLEAAERVGRAPIDPRAILSPAEAGEMDDSQVLIVTTRLSGGTPVRGAWRGLAPRLLLSLTLTSAPQGLDCRQAPQR